MFTVQSLSMTHVFVAASNALSRLVMPGKGIINDRPLDVDRSVLNKIELFLGKQTAQQERQVDMRNNERQEDGGLLRTA